MLRVELGQLADAGDGARGTLEFRQLAAEERLERRVTHLRAGEFHDLDAEVILGDRSRGGGRLGGRSRSRSRSR